MLNKKIAAECQEAWLSVSGDCSSPGSLVLTTFSEAQRWIFANKAFYDAFNGMQILTTEPPNAHYMFADSHGCNKQNFSFVGWNSSSQDAVVSTIDNLEENFFLYREGQVTY